MRQAVAAAHGSRHALTSTDAGVMHLLQSGSPNSSNFAGPWFAGQFAQPYPLFELAH